MSALEILIERGAQVVGGDVVFRNKSMGRLRNGVFDISHDGEQELAIEEVEVKPAKRGRKPADPAPQASSAADDILDAVE